MIITVGQEFSILQACAVRSYETIAEHNAAEASTYFEFIKSYISFTVINLYRIPSSREADGGQPLGSE